MDDPHQRPRPQRLSNGRYTAEESDIVRKAVQDFCAMKQVEVSRLCSECDHKAELKGAWMEIAKSLPHRCVQSVYRHGLRILHPFKRGNWSDQECESLVNLVELHGKKWAAIQAKLNRSADSCRDKYREFAGGYIKGRWKEPETEILKRLIREHLNADPTADIKELGKMVEREGLTVPWSSISKKMEKRSRLSCFKKWQKMTGLCSPSDGNYCPPPESDDPVAPVIQDNVATMPAKKIAATKAIKIEAQEAPTAGAAAAAALAAALHQNTSTPETTDATTAAAAADAEFDVYLLSELANLDASRSSDVDWESFRLDNAQNRWVDLVGEWQNNNGDNEDALALPISEMAQAMLDRKASAQRAAETVEAVDLPAPELLQATV